MCCTVGVNPVEENKKYCVNRYLLILDNTAPPSRVYFTLKLPNYEITHYPADGPTALFVNNLNFEKRKKEKRIFLL